MRIMIKGGVWKNTEDEILKAAVMKYGKNQWARISSLLVRKSAKQCKARWYEWLDPSIKKTEWTREEDEKLLHLAKLMPTQWRTIAPIVGRTPSQCLERYEKLLDAACVKDENYEPADDPRKLRPGEIDPNPESKPARPDPVDMDEDEKEMLSEARARLANTRGKKAKRKAREKQLEEARRLASLQKRRELKAAGIDGKQRKRKRKGIDYNAEIPFEKKPPPGFFDVADEERQVEQPKFPTTIEELEGKRRVDIEAQLRKQDVQRNKILQRHDAPSAVMQVNKLNDPEAVRKRPKLMLPAPQISDRELEEIAKMGYASDLLLREDEGSGPARALLANYNQTPRLGMTPLRTPQRTPGGKGDAIMMEAENQARLREAQTPLFGGENPELHPSDFAGVTPRKREIQTPNPIATPLHTPEAIGSTPRIGMTPSRELSTFGLTPKATPIKDDLHINEGMETPDSFKAESIRQVEIRRNLRDGLSALPAPQNEYRIAVPEIPSEDIEVGEQMEEDMSDKLARQKAEEAARRDALLRKRSKVLQRNLPRPPVAAVEFLKNSLTGGVEDRSSIAPANFMEQADELIRKELTSLLEHDNAKYPFEDDLSKEKRKNKNTLNGRRQVPIPQIDEFDEEELREASTLIEEELSLLRVGMGHEEATVDDFAEAHNACLEDMMFFSGRNSYGLASVASATEKLAALQYEFENVRNHMESSTKKAVRLEQKVKVLTQGYQMRAGKLWTQIEGAFKQTDTAATELECFKALHRQEQLAASNRIESLREAVSQQKDLERRLQIQYENLVVEQDNLQRLLIEYKEQAPQQNKTSKENGNNTEQTQLDASQVDTGGLQTDNVVTEGSKISPEYIDVQMVDASEAADGHVSFPQIEDTSERGSNYCQQKSDAENSESASEMHIDDVCLSDGSKINLENQKINQVSVQNQNIEYGTQRHDIVATSVGQISVAQDVDMVEAQQQNSTSVVHSNDENGVLVNENIELVKQQDTVLVAQSDSQDSVSDDGIFVQVKEQNETMPSSVPSGNHITKIDREKSNQHPDKQMDVSNVLAQYASSQIQTEVGVAVDDQKTASDGQNAVVDGCFVQVKEQNETMPSSIPSDSHITKEVGEKSNQHPDEQVEVSNDLAQDASAQTQTEVGVAVCYPKAASEGQNVVFNGGHVVQVKEQNETVPSSIPSDNHITKEAGDKSNEHPDKQMQVSNVLAQDASLQAQLDVGVTMENRKATSEDQVLLQNSDNELDHPTSIAEGGAASPNTIT